MKSPQEFHPNGELIVIEGIDKAGKTTTIDGILDRMEQSVVTTTEPCDELPLEEAVRDAIGSSGTPQLTTLFLFMASHADHLDKIIKPNLNSGETIVCDRYIDSRFAYQSVALDSIWEIRETEQEAIETSFEESEWPEMSLHEDIAEVISPESMYFIFLARLANGGTDDGLHRVVSQGDATVNLQEEMEASNLKNLHQNPLSPIREMQKYSSPFGWLKYLHDMEGWSVKPSKVLYLHITVEEFANRMAEDKEDGEAEEIYENSSFQSSVIDSYESVIDQREDAVKIDAVNKSPHEIIEECISEI